MFIHRNKIIDPIIQILHFVIQSVVTQNSLPYFQQIKQVGFSTFFYSFTTNQPFKGGTSDTVHGLLYKILVQSFVVVSEHLFCTFHLHFGIGGMANCDFGFT